MKHVTPPCLRCRRNAQGVIVALSRQKLSAQEQKTGAWEEVDPAAAEVEAFLREGGDHSESLRQSDTELARVLEDLIDVLITRGLIQFTDLPQAAQAKLLERQQTRANLTHRLQLLPFGDDSGVY